jgi:ABC-type multidrug transport system ATPase subunit
MIDARGLTKRYGEKLAVDDLTFKVNPGIVTGFLGPNGSGKSTTMRLILGLDAPTGGSVTVNGKAYRDHAAPLHEAGVLLEARAVHTGRSAYNHLLALAQTQGIPRSRVQELIELVGLGDVANKRVGQFSLGMGQRLGIAQALLGDPRVVILDEPINGLDPEGIHWIRDLLRSLAAEGRTVFLSSHLMSEMALTDNRLLLSASDLVAFLECEHLSALDLRVAGGIEVIEQTRMDSTALVARKGDEHEHAFLESLIEQRADVVVVPSVFDGVVSYSEALKRTEAAMRAGAGVIYQAALADGEWRGFADFLERVPAPCPAFRLLT